MRSIQFTGSAAGPAPWTKLTALLLAWTGVAWLGAELDARVAAVVLVLGVVVFWLLVRKTDERADPLPGWTIVPLAIAFVAGLFLAALMASVDRDLVGAGYGVWFVLWLQFGLWLKNRSTRRASSAIAR